MSNPNANQDYIDRLIIETRSDLQELDLYHNTPTTKNDHEQFEQAIMAALREANRLDASNVEEIWDVKPLHDRIHALVIMLRVARNNLERLEHYAESALDKARKISHSVEEPYDDHEL